MSNVTYTTLKNALRDLEAQLEWINDPTLRAYNTPDNKKEIKALNKSIAFLQKQVLFLKGVK